MEYKNYFKNQNPYEIIENYVVNLGNVIGPTGPGNVLDGTNDNNILIWDDTNNTWKQNEEEQTKIKNNIFSNNISLASSGRSNFVSEDLKNGNWTYMNMGNVFNDTHKNDNPESGILFHSDTSGNSGYNAYIGTWKDNITHMHSNIRMDIGSLSNVRNLGNTSDNAISWPTTPAVSIRPAINKVGINHVPSTDATETLTVGGSTKIDNQTSSSSTTTGALTVAGGVGIAENLNVGSNVNANKINASDELVYVKSDTSNVKITNVQGGVGVTFNQNTNTNDKRFDIFQTATEDNVYMRYNLDSSPSIRFNKTNDRIYLESDDVHSSGRILYKPDTNKEVGIAGPQGGLGLWLRPDVSEGTNRFDITNLGNTTRFEYNVNSVLEPSLEFNKSDNKISLDSDDVNINANTNISGDLNVHKNSAKLDIYDNTSGSTSQVLKASSSGIFSEAIRGTAAADATSSNNKTVKYNSVTGEFYIE